MESKPYSEKYTTKLINAEEDIYVLELTPKSTKSAYSRLTVNVHKTNYYSIHMQYYDKGKKKTKMLMSDVKYFTGFTDDEFTVRKLKR